QRFVPELEAIALTDQHRGARQAGVLAQARRDQDATAAVELEVGRVTDHQTLQTARDGIERRQTAQLELDLLPLGQRIDEQATIGAIHGCDQTPIGALDDALAITGRHREPPLRVERHLVCTAEHHDSETGREALPAAPLPHSLPLFPTSLHYMDAPGRSQKNLSNFPFGDRYLGVNRKLGRGWLWTAFQEIRGLENVVEVLRSSARYASRRAAWDGRAGSAQVPRNSLTRSWRQSGNPPRYRGGVRSSKCKRCPTWFVGPGFIINYCLTDMERPCRQQPLVLGL